MTRFLLFFVCMCLCGCTSHKNKKEIINRQDFKKICTEFNVNLTSIQPLGQGNCNQTYLVNSSDGKRYVLQQLQQTNETDVARLMNNIGLISSYLIEKTLKSHGNPDKEVLNFLRAKSGKFYYKNGDKFYRMYKFIDDVITPELVDVSTFAEVGRGFGKFANLLADFPADKLYETYPNFHNTPVRLEQLLQAVKDNKANRLNKVQKELREYQKYANKYANILMQALQQQKIPYRVVHNDTKADNILIDKTTKKALCVIDYDTIMPGSILFDYGDALRAGASTAKSDEKDLSKVHFDMNKFKVFTKAYLNELGSSITQNEKELMPVSVLIITMECGMRFLTDYLNGDVYFNIKYKEHNLNRMRTQLKLVQEIEKNIPEMTKIIKSL